MPIMVGTSGWQYRHWRDVLYPREVPQRRWLEHYAGLYRTVENDGTFYRLPPEATFAQWRDRTPDDFVMAVKASRYLTHVRRLADPVGPVARLMAAAAGLGGKLGPVLLQLPPTLRADPARLAACLDAFADAADRAAAPIRVAVEPRHPSWWTAEVKEVLTGRNAALCWADQGGRPVTPLWRTADWGYLRFHRGAAEPRPRYGRRALASWLDRIMTAWPDDAQVFAYFNNDPGGAAVLDSARFGALVRSAGRAVTRTPGTADLPARVR
ncbi:MAG: DUF72 domain-containing protein [Streptosporangiaceae bacterium]